MITAPERLYLDAKGKVVKAGSPKAVKLLCSKGQKISNEEAKRYGIKGRKAPAEDKARKSKGGNKGGGKKGGPKGGKKNKG